MDRDLAMDSQLTLHDSDALGPTIVPALVQPSSAQFLEKSPKAAAARAIYIRTLFAGITAISLVIFGVFFDLLGICMDHTASHPSRMDSLKDFDGGAVGQSISNALSSINPGTNGVVWEVVPASQFPGGISQLQHAVAQEKTWYALSINSGASANLSAAVAAADPSYDPSTAVTFMGTEARNELIFPIHRSIVTGELEAITQQFALQFLKNISSSSNIGTLLSTAPQIVVRPIYYTVDNLRPFDVPVASAVTFVGLIYLVILSFFIVMVSNAARDIAGFNESLSTGSLIRVRIATAFVAYFFISLFYTLLSRAFQLPFDRHFGRWGIVIFWMLNWTGMLACGLALESMITLLTIRFIPFFLILWIISNVSITEYPLQVLPHVYHYGFAWPFYNISRAVRSIVFSTKNDVGLNFGILLGWVGLSCITLSFFQWFMRRRASAPQAKPVPT
ncbi:DUF3533 domain-containing protein [Mycena sanguinolenta]|uniref:DUF3533 domain-containing protein n=1 Tax=Mycena sanguinolenta TaxID=230812 RepID=A0A8H6YNC6_9AGAR|nr:DUF3533 domain-containing protein [Mycena sanguinolenta]